ncbi:zymogen granule protein 16 homolog B [Fukomys damarensis]|nr:zymogen granule protein 16 homolog B [Fukomys damarensis]
MLLLLTLTLLVSPTCWGRIDNSFSTAMCSEAAIKAIRVAVSYVGNIISVQVKLGKYWDVVHGHQGGTVMEFNLDDDEYFTEVHGSKKINIRYLLLCTNKNRCASFGKNDGQQFFSFPPEADQVLKAIAGVVGPIGLQKLEWRWGNLQTEPTTTPPATSQTKK